MDLNKMIQELKKCLFWHDYEDGAGLMPICVAQPQELKWLIERLEKERERETSENEHNSRTKGTNDQAA